MSNFKFFTLIYSALTKHYNKKIIIQFHMISFFSVILIK